MTKSVSRTPSVKCLIKCNKSLQLVNIIIIIFRFEMYGSGCGTIPHSSSKCLWAQVGNTSQCHLFETWEKTEVSGGNFTAVIFKTWASPTHCKLLVDLSRVYVEHACLFFLLQQLLQLASKHSGVLESELPVGETRAIHGTTGFGLNTAVRRQKTTVYHHDWGAQIRLVDISQLLFMQSSMKAFLFLFA